MLSRTAQRSVTEAPGWLRANPCVRCERNWRRQGRIVVHGDLMFLNERPCHMKIFALPIWSLGNPLKVQNLLELVFLPVYFLLPV